VAYTTFTFCVVYVLPVGVMLTAYALIARELARRYRRQRGAAPPPRFSDSPSVGSCRDSLHGSMEDVGGVRVVTAATDRKQRLRDKRVIVRMLTAIVLLFAVSWFPFFTGQVARKHLLTYHTHMNKLTVLWIGFCLTGPISLCLRFIFVLCITVCCIHA